MSVELFGFLFMTSRCSLGVLRILGPVYTEVGDPR